MGFSRIDPVATTALAAAEAYTDEHVSQPINFYLDSPAADPSYAGAYLAAPEAPNVAAETNIATVVAAADTLVGQWVSPSGTPNMQEIGEGIVEIDLKAARTAGTKGIFVYAKLFTITVAGVETLIATSEPSSTISSASRVSVVLHMHTPFQLMSLVDRLVFKVYASPSGTGTNPTLTTYFRLTNLARIELSGHPISVTPSAHAASHQPGGGDTMAVDAAVGTGSLRTLGAGAQQACAGNDARLSDSRTPAGTATAAVAPKVVTLIENAAAIVTSAGAMDFGGANDFKITLTVSGTVRYPDSGLVEGACGKFRFQQPAGGACVVTWAAGYVYVGGVAIPAIDAAASKVSYMHWMYDSAASKIVLSYQPPSW